MPDFPPPPIGIPTPDYDSGWVDLATDQKKTLTHDLGTQEVLEQTYVIYDVYNRFIVGFLNGIHIYNMTTTQVDVDNWMGAPITVRLLLWKLE